MPYAYLGYWIKDSHKMNYKVNFKPYELLVDGEWMKPDFTK
jgi:arginine-tRNA-protein transferase